MSEPSINTVTMAVKGETKKQIKERERQEACERLRELLPVGSTVYCVLRHVSRSGMRREISFLVGGCEGMQKGAWIQDIDWLVCRALDMHLGKAGIKVDGCGMDMGFHVVYSLSRVIYRDGFPCIGKGCPSNDHSNGDRNYEPHAHSDPGYALGSRWV